MLEKKIMELLDDFDGDAGIFIKNPNDDFVMDINGNDVYYAASVIKLNVLWELFLQVDAKTIALDDRMALTEDRDIKGSGVLRELHTGLMLAIEDLAILMMIISDDVATNMLIDRLRLEKINSSIQQLGLKHTQISRKMMNPEDAIRVKPNQDNLTTPSEVGALLENILFSSDISESSRRKLLDILKKQKLNDRLPALLPNGVIFAHKTGSLPGVVNDAGILFLEDQVIILVVLIKNLKENRGGTILTNSIGKLVFDYFSGGNSSSRQD